MNDLTESGRRVLVVADGKNGELNDLMCDLRDHEFDPVGVTTTDAVLALVASDFRLDAAALCLYQRDTDAVELCRHLRKETQMPVVVVDKMRSPSSRQLALEAGADVVSQDWRLFISELDGLFRSRRAIKDSTHGTRHKQKGVGMRDSTEPGIRVLVIDESKEGRVNALTSDLKCKYFSPVGVMNAAVALALLSSSFRLDAAIVNLEPNGDPVEICRQIREESEIPVIAVDWTGDESNRVLALDAGADLYLRDRFFVLDELISGLDDVMDAQ